MAATVNLTQARERANELSRVLNESLAEDRDSGRAQALAYGVLLMLRPPVAESAAPALVMWVCELLILLESGLAAVARDVPAAEAVYKAISRLQEVLGVRAEQRAWIFDEEGGAG